MDIGSKLSTTMIPQFTPNKQKRLLLLLQKGQFQLQLIVILCMVPTNSTRMKLRLVNGDDQNVLCRIARAGILQKCYQKLNHIFYIKRRARFELKDDAGSAIFR